MLALLKQAARCSFVSRRRRVERKTGRGRRGRRRNYRAHLRRHYDCLPAVWDCPTGFARQALRTLFVCPATPIFAILYFPFPSILFPARPSTALMQFLHNQKVCCNICCLQPRNQANERHTHPCTHSYTHANYCMWVGCVVCVRGIPSPLSQVAAAA